MNREDVVASVVEAAGGEIIARVRLQKAIYLLDQLGFKTGFEFEYHHFGPYARDIDLAVAGARAEGWVKEEIHHRERDGVSYSVFRIVGDGFKRGSLGSLKHDRVGELLQQFADTHITVLELAATIHWLWKYEKRNDWLAEVKKRKSQKATPERLRDAEALLKELRLMPVGLAA